MDVSSLITGSMSHFLKETQELWKLNCMSGTCRTLLPKLVYQGEAPIASANTLLGDFMIEGLKPEKPGYHPNVNVRFDFDVNGMLHVSAKDRDTGNSKGFAFVEMNTQAEAQKAVSMFNGLNLDDRELKVNLAKPREPQARRSGFDQRGWGRGKRG